MNHRLKIIGRVLRLDGFFPAAALVAGFVLVLEGGLNANSAGVLSILFSLSTILSCIKSINRNRREIALLEARLPTESTRSCRRGRSGLLATFAWYCGKGNREHIEIIEADLKKDCREMIREGRHNWFIRSVILWKIVGTIVPIVWDGCLRLLSALLPLGRIIAKIKGLP